MITGISGFGFFGSKNGRFVTHKLFFKNLFSETPVFIVFWGCARFGPGCQGKKKGNFGHPPKKKNLTDN